MILSGVLRRGRSPGFLTAGVAIARSFHVPRPSLSNPRILISRHNLQSTHLINFTVYNFSSSVGKKASSDADLIRVIEAEIKCAEECDDYDRVEEIPEGFPFEIQNEKGKSTITLKRRYFGENIEVLVSMPSLVTGEEPEHDRSAGPGGEEGEKERPAQSSIPLTVNFSKNEEPGLEFCCNAYPDELVIDTMSFKEIKDSGEEMLAYQGPDFSDLDENLQKAWYKYLEVRGISAMTTNFLHEYMMNKDSLEYLLWLRDLKKLIEK